MALSSGIVIRSDQHPGSTRPSLGSPCWQVPGAGLTSLRWFSGPRFANVRIVRIAVISDTHDRYPASLPGQLRGAEEIWHLGDVCRPDILAGFEQLGPPLRVVRGNCDAHPWPLTLDLEREGVRFHLVHIPPRRPPRHAAVILHGHTHVPRDETDPRGVRWLNPGCITRPNRGAPASFAWLTVEAGNLTGWELVRTAS